MCTCAHTHTNTGPLVRLVLVKVRGIYLLALRGQCVWDPNTVELWETRPEVKAGDTPGCAVVCVRACTCMCTGGVMKRSHRGGCSLRITGRVMEGVHEEFRLALRENK